MVNQNKFSRDQDRDRIVRVEFDQLVFCPFTDGAKISVYYAGSYIRRVYDNKQAGIICE